MNFKNSSQLGTTFVKACYEGDLATINNILDNDGHLHLTKHHYSVGFDFACYNGYKDIVKEIMEKARDQVSLVNGIENAFAQEHHDIIDFIIRHNFHEIYFTFKHAFDFEKIDTVKSILSHEAIIEDNKTINSSSIIKIGGCKTDINKLFISACEKGHYSLIELLLTDKKLVKNPDIHIDDDVVLLQACYKGDLKLVDFLLNSPKLKEHANIHAQDGSALLHAVNEGHFDLLEYLTTSPNLKEHADIHAQNDYALVLAIKKDDLKVVKFFLEDPRLNTHIDILKNIDELYFHHMNECMNALQDEKTAYEYKVFNYLISEHKLTTKDPIINNKIQDMLEGIKYLELEHNLPLNNFSVKPRKMKI